jgi:Ca-activated chloride channel family protein
MLIAMGPRAVMAGVVTALCAALAAALQDPVPQVQEPRQVPRFSSGVQVVEVYATVTDAKGEPVAGLDREAFEVYEDGELQQLQAFAAGEFPLSVALAVDRSASMADERLERAKVAGRAFLNALRPMDQAMVISISSRVEPLTPLSTDRAGQLNALEGLRPWSTTALHDAVIEAIELVQAGTGRRALVLLSDGVDRYSDATAAEATDAARRSDVMVYPVALGRDRSGLFPRLASLTGGRSFHLTRPDAVEATLSRIARELRMQYLLGYNPPAAAVSSGGPEWRSIEVRVNRPGLGVRARDGYFR